MFDKFREAMAVKPWIGWVVALFILAIAAAVFFMRGRSESVYSPDRMKEILTIRYTDTDEVVEVPRGRLEKMMREGGSSLDPSQGIINPKTGKATGFLVDADDWKEMVARINQEKEAARAGATPGRKILVPPNRPTPSPTTPREDLGAPPVTPPPPPGN